MLSGLCGESSKQIRRCMEMFRFKTVAGVLSALMFAGMIQVAQAGVIRYTGKKIAQGANNATQVAAAGGSAVAAGTASAGNATANGLKSGASAAENGVATAAGTAAAAGAAAGGAVANGVSGAASAVKDAPGSVVDGTKSVAQKVWGVIW